MINAAVALPLLMAAAALGQLRHVIVECVRTHRALHQAFPAIAALRGQRSLEIDAAVAVVAGLTFADLSGPDALYQLIGEVRHASPVSCTAALPGCSPTPWPATGDRRGRRRDPRAHPAPTGPADRTDPLPDGPRWPELHLLELA
jgi:hypothetical protein